MFLYDLENTFRDKKVLIMGLGLHGGGAGAASFFAKLGARVLVTDLKTRRELARSFTSLKRFKNISYVLGGHRKDDIIGADIIIKNPGVPDDSSWMRLAKVHGVPISSDIEFFFKLCPAKIIGITGTKGKSTTAQLLFNILRSSARRRVWLAGNIRKSVLKILPKIRKNHLVVLELSSFQLDSLANSRLSPQVAVVTNIFPDHLNRYKDFRNYAASKAGIFRYQKSHDYLFVPSGGGSLRNLTRRVKPRKIFVDFEKTLKPYSAIVEKRFFRHQLSSVALAVSVGRHLGVSAKDVHRTIENFHQLPGRLEKVRVFGGVTFVNDTTATNPSSATAALKAVSQKSYEVQPRKISNVVLIAGGSDKKLPVNDFARAICEFAKVVVFLPGEATGRMKSKIKNQKSKIIMCEARTMEEAVIKAYGLAERGDTVLLSPGAASFGLFQNEFDRGGQFVKAVMKLKPKR